jgi:hypothetical protein
MAALSTQMDALRNAGRLPKSTRDNDKGRAGIDDPERDLFMRGVRG